MTAGKIKEYRQSLVIIFVIISLLLYKGNLKTIYLIIQLR